MGGACAVRLRGETPPLVSVDPFWQLSCLSFRLIFSFFGVGGGVGGGVLAGRRAAQASLKPQYLSFDQTLFLASKGVSVGVSYPGGERRKLLQPPFFCSS